MKSLLTTLAGIILLASFSRCEKKCTQLNICRPTLCNLPGYNKFIGFHAQDVDTQIFLFYKPNGLFDQRTDSFAYIDEDVVGGHIYNETDTQYLALSSVSGNNQNTKRLNDVRIILPNVRTYNLTEVMVDGDYYVEDEFKCSNGSKPCVRHIVSVKVDGVYNDLTKNRDMALILYK